MNENEARIKRKIMLSKEAFFLYRVKDYKRNKLYYEWNNM